MRLVLLTGAGIPDYRGPQGLWRRHPEHERLVTYDCYVADARIVDARGCSAGTARRGGLSRTPRTWPSPRARGP